jgi:hypothetical protein
VTHPLTHTRQALKDKWGRLEELSKADHEPHVLSVRWEMREANAQIVHAYRLHTGEHKPDDLFPLGDDPRDHKAMWKALKKNRARLEKALGEPL